MGSVNHTAKTRARVIAEFRKCGRVDLACKAAGVDRTCHYRWLKKYVDYRQAFEEAAAEVADMIEGEIFRRAITGVEEPVFNHGKRAMDFATDEHGNLKRGEDGKFVAVPATIRRYSDQCLLAMAAARVPGYNFRLDHRAVDDKSKDRTLTLEAVRAYMNSIPDPPDAE